MKIPNYTSADEKQKAFPQGYRQIATKEEFDTWYKQASKESEKLYRGIYEANFKNYTSAQRESIIREIEDPHKLIEAEVRELWKSNDKLLTKYCQSLEVDCTDMYLMSFAQHYGGISPLLDFTRDINKALYFMLDKAKLPESGAEDGDLRNYMSLYSVVYSEELENKFTSLIEKYKDTDFSSKEYITEANKILDKTILSSKIIHKISLIGFTNGAIWRLERPYPRTEEEQKKRLDYMMEAENFNYLLMSEMQPLLISNEIKHYNLLGKNITWGTLICNMNEVAQEGCFIYFENKTEPLEKPLDCVDIHKSLIPYIQKKYLSKFTRTDIYPDPYDMVKKSLFNAYATI